MLQETFIAYTFWARAPGGTWEQVSRGSYDMCLWLGEIHWLEGWSFARRVHYAEVFGSPELQ